MGFKFQLFIFLSVPITSIHILHINWWRRFLKCPSMGHSSITYQCIGQLALAIIAWEPAISYRWTGWVWEIIGWSSRLQEIYRSFRGIYRIYSNLIKENRRMLTCNRLDLQTLGPQPVMSKNLPDHRANHTTRGAPIINARRFFFVFFLYNRVIF